MKRKIILKAGIVLIAAGILTGGLVYRLVINKPHIDYEKARPAYIVSAFELYNSYRVDRKFSETKYNGQVVLLNGRLDKVEVAEDLTTGVFVFEQGMFGDEGIRCSMLPQHATKIKSIPEGTEVKLKGYLTGFNDSDVIIEQCSVIQ